MAVKLPLLLYRNGKAMKSQGTGDRTFFETTTKKNLENTDEGKNRPALILINRNRFLPPVLATSKRDR